jgi:hypothetical protein
MRTGEKICIVPSTKLTEIKLEQLSDREGNIEEIVISKRNQLLGCWVKLEGEPFEKEQEWFIPTASVESTINN